MDHKRALSLIVLFSIVFATVISLLLVAANKKLVELTALCCSNYSYSTVTHKSVAKDDYYLFDAGISFTTSPNENRSLNADVVMQAEGSSYTDAVFWNADQLSVQGVAVSKSLAISHDLRKGDKLYSKHSVDGKIHEYSIEQILSDAVMVRVSAQTDFHDGIIIFGYDELYDKNISHTWITFTDRSVEELSADCEVKPESIIYRKDEIAGMIKEVAPYIIALIGFSIILMIAFSAFISKGVAHNFRRMIMLGFERRALNKAFAGNMFGFGGCLIIISGLMPALLFLLLKVCPAGYISLICVLIIEVLSLCVAGREIRQRLWRG